QGWERHQGWTRVVVGFLPVRIAFISNASDLRPSNKPPAALGFRKVCNRTSCAKRSATAIQPPIPSVLRCRGAAKLLHKIRFGECHACPTLYLCRRWPARYGALCG